MPRSNSRPKNRQRKTPKALKPGNLLYSNPVITYPKAEPPVNPGVRFSPLSLLGLGGLLHSRYGLR